MRPVARGSWPSLELPVLSVAAIQGRVYAAGAMLALAHDLRVMRADRGWFCLPEVELGIVFTPAMARLLSARLCPQVCHEAILTGRRYGGREAHQARIVDVVATAQALRPAVLELARERGCKPRAAVTAMRSVLYRDVIEALRRRALQLSRRLPPHWRPRPRRR
ncbi:MAG: enoyl-CoA hydratase/isomerase family protein [Solirubrobacteraceae bacterium]